MTHSEKQGKELTVIALLFALCALLVFLILLSSSFFPEGDARNNFVVVSSSMATGFCTLFGVIMTLFFERKKRKKDRIYSHIPEVFIPSKYDVSKAVFVKMVEHNSDAKGSAWPNMCLYIENTAKASFQISTLVIGDSEFLPVNASYIDAGSLFCLKFLCKELPETAQLNLVSVDNMTYQFTLRFINGRPVSIAREDDVSKRD